MNITNVSTSVAALSLDIYNDNKFTNENKNEGNIVDKATSNDYVYSTYMNFIEFLLPLNK